MRICLEGLPTCLERKHHQESVVVHAPPRGRKGLTFKVLVHLDIIEPPPDEYGNVSPRKVDWRFGIINGERSTRDRRDPPPPDNRRDRRRDDGDAGRRSDKRDGGPGCSGFSHGPRPPTRTDQRRATTSGSIARPRLGGTVDQQLHPQPRYA
jgi:hypothetical protein